MILVTGATGFVGINLVQELLALGEEVLALDLEGFPPELTFSADEAKRVEFRAVDVRNRDALSQVFREHRISTVVHAAAVTVPYEEDEAKARLVMEVNAVGTLNMLEAAREGGVTRFVYVSSSGVYGSYGHGVVPVHESVPYAPMGLYVAAKIYSELMCRRFNEMGHFRVVVSRIGSPYGPWERPTRTRQAMCPVQRLMDMAMKGQEALIYGYDSVRDWTHVRDIARGVALLATIEATRLRHLVYNVSTGENVSAGAVAEAIAGAVPKFRYRFVENPQEANVNFHLPNPRGPLDITRIKVDCDFKPVFDIRRGIADYARWYTEYETGRVSPGVRTVKEER